MSTANFRYPNLSTHYTIGVDEDLEDFMYDDIIDNITHELVGIGGYEADRWLGRDRHVIAAFEVAWYDHDYQEWSSLDLQVTVESGYYAGAMFDVALDDLPEDLNKTTQARIDRLVRKIEKVLAAHCLQLIRVATFSNGEAIYEPASKRSRIKAIVRGEV